MEASFLADEHFDSACCNRLRAKGHDVITVRSLNVDKRGDGWSDAGDGWSDAEVLAEARRLNRVLLTDNVRDFRKLHREVHWHEGIVICAPEADAQKKADRIDRIVRELMRQRNSERLTGEWIDARPD